MSESDPVVNGEPSSGRDPASGPDSAAAFPVVGIGASAGGLDAFKQLLSRLPPEPGMALIFVQHLDPTHESILPELLADVTDIPVHRVEDGMLIEPNHVYVTPPNAILTVVDGRLHLTPRPANHRLFMPIDYLLRSLASDFGRRSIGVILSGGGTDGTLGIQDIKAALGITFAQSEASAAHDSMPRCAILSGSIDFILPPPEIADQLIRIGSHPYIASIETVPLAPPAGAPELAELSKLFGLIRSETGVDFSTYKRNTIMRRIGRRMTIRRAQSLPDYVRILESDRGERVELYQDLLIRVTSFFRDPEAFRALRDHVFATLIGDRLPDSPIRIWVAGCSTGEEVYSIAITLMEALAEKAINVPLKILATDIDDRALDIARAGSYIDNIAMDVSPERLSRFFVAVEGSHKIVKSIRDMCVFAHHDLTRDPPFARLDLISCRNLLIYLDLDMQRRVFPLFHYALKDSGYLILGPSESIGTFGELFRTIDREHKVFAKNATAARPHISFDIYSPIGQHHSSLDPAQNKGSAGAVSFNLSREVDRILTARYSPPAVVIDEDLRIVLFRGQTDIYLAPAPGSPSFDLLAMVREGLIADLRLAINSVKSEKTPVVRRGTFLDHGGQVIPVEIEVMLLRAPSPSPMHFLVMFRRPPAQAKPAETSVSVTGERLLDAEEARNQVVSLRDELAATREYLQSITEESEATTEELRAANEEILSSNEELQSTNEELNTAKEEMQSTNEELTTVNQELSSRNNELARASDDLLNLFNGVNIPIVMVCRELRIRRYTAPAERLLNIIPTDVGRPIGDIRFRLEFPELERHIGEVIESLAPQDHEARDRDGKWYSVRIRPYVTLENKIDGASVAIVDIDQIKRATEQLKRARDRADAIVETVQQPLVVVDRELRVMRANQAFYRVFCKSSGRADGRPLAGLGAGPWCDAQLAARLRDVQETGDKLQDIEVDINPESPDPRSFRVAACRIDWDGSESGTILLALDDVTDQRRELERARILLLEQAARAEAERANRRKDEFLAMLAHELRNPLSPILNSLMVLRASGATPGDIAWTAEIMERQVRHMSRLIDDLLDVSRIVRGVIRLRREPVELNPILERVLDVVGPLIKSRRHELTVMLTPEPVIIVADPVRIEQIFTNLLNNAAKFTQEGGKIWLTAGREKSHIVIRVRNNGIGISREQLKDIFDLFVQVDTSLERSLGGLGIGLTLAKSLIELHGGTIEVQSEGPGCGSEFVVRLPTSAAALLTPATSPNLGDVAGRRVLVVDDNVDAAQTLALLVKHYGHEVETAADGLTAIETARAFKPDIAFIDIGMPGMNGYETARRMRTDPATKNIVLVAVTGYGQDDDRRRSFQAGFNQHAVKPVGLDRLNQILRSVPS